MLDLTKEKRKSDSLAGFTAESNAKQEAETPTTETDRTTTGFPVTLTAKRHVETQDRVNRLIGIWPNHVYRPSIAKKNLRDFRRQAIIKHRRHSRSISATGIRQIAVDVAISTNVRRKLNLETPTLTTETSRTATTTEMIRAGSETPTECSETTTECSETPTECPRETNEWRKETILIEIARTILNAVLCRAMRDFNEISLPRKRPAQRMLRQGLRKSFSLNLHHLWAPALVQALCLQTLACPLRHTLAPAPKMLKCHWGHSILQQPTCCSSPKLPACCQSLPSAELQTAPHPWVRTHSSDQLSPCITR